MTGEKRSHASESKETFKKQAHRSGERKVSSAAQFPRVINVTINQRFGFCAVNIYSPLILPPCKKKNPTTNQANLPVTNLKRDLKTKY